jgi:hypothetical protein
MKKEKIYNARVSDCESVWQFSYFGANLRDFYSKYCEEFRDKLEYLDVLGRDNLVVKTGIYRDVINDAEKGECIRADKSFLDVYSYNDSLVLVSGDYKNAFQKDVGWVEPDELRVSIRLKTKDGFFVKEKHGKLESKISEVIRRDLDD